MQAATETRKEEILRIAARLFKEKGYSAVTMRDIAKAMGMKAASLYNHIDSKQDILTSIIVSLAEEFTQGMDSIKNSDASCIRKLGDIVALHVAIAGNNPDGMATLNNDWMHLKDRKAHYLTLRHNYEEDFRNILRHGIDQGEIIDGNIEIMLFSILSTLRSLYLWIPKKEEMHSNRLATELSRVLIEGITA